MTTASQILPRAVTGIRGLDDILGGGITRNRLHLLEGTPGTGKTTIALKFLLSGAELGEAGMSASLKPRRSCAKEQALTAGRSATR